ncbi:glycerate kinase [Paenibacillus xerothermodurans]|uniref:Glycerate kinase n=1 Tax=Paenibacillus xerothermodurans TaxID=1977292 RepID=A0A2W1NWV7_PAEXE|nr:glycerate kinase [Paenibacillus xerothermodurans]PZE20152.1 glycerate kinase [Paenibacillus xerothermodurans]
MKIIIAPDSFKGSISAADAAGAIEKGIKRFLPEAVTVLVPVADGGEGTMDSLIGAAGGRKVAASVTGPLGAPVDAAYGLLGPDYRVAIVEMAAASGLCLITPEQRDPLNATTFGTGELIKQALAAGCREFILALGGSATNDGGAGMLEALGVRLLDAAGQPVARGGGSLSRIATIDATVLDPRIAESRFLIATDVQNPLLGPHGASHVFGPQKGATPSIVDELERNMAVWADLIEAHTGVRVHEMPGAGAAGGIGAAFLAFFPTTIRRGIDVVIQYSRLHEHLRDADLVITGEGQIDYQTASGKTPMGIAQEANKYNVPTIALAGSVGAGIDALYDVGIRSVHSIAGGPLSLQEAMARAAELLEATAEQVLRTFCAAGIPQPNRA